VNDKYRPLREHLDRSPSDEPIELRFVDIAALVGGLPPSAAERRWWANTTSARRPQALAWMSSGRLVEHVDLGSETVRFSAVSFDPSAPGVEPGRRRTPPAMPPILDGVRALLHVIEQAGYPTLEHAVASNTIFLHPATVAQTKGQALFPIIRDPARRGVVQAIGERLVLFDDNTSPTLAFLWAARRNKGPDIQFNHIWGDSQNIATYTSLWNLCVTPAFLAKTTDGSNSPGVVALLKYRARELYGHVPQGEVPPTPPAVYHELHWAPFPPPVDDLEAELRVRLTRAPKSRPARAAREIGWLYSAWRPDRTLGPTA
jgi:hypothetical protein